MKHISIGLFGDVEDIGKELGKKGTSSDITLYDYKKGDDSVVFIEPIRYPEKIAPLIYTINMMDYALVFINEIKPEIGETLLALDISNEEKGFFVVGEYLDIENFKKIISNTSMKDFEILKRDSIQIREKMIGLDERDKSKSFTKISIDHFFAVKSVGTVILGKIDKGNVKIHDSLRIYPTENKASIKSIQVQDKDVKDAGTNARVGLALKGILPDDLERGMILSDGELLILDDLKLDMKWNPYSKKEIGVGEDYQIVIGLQLVAVRVENREENIIKLKLIKPIVCENGDRVVLIDGSAKIRIIGISKVSI